MGPIEGGSKGDCGGLGGVGLAGSPAIRKAAAARGADAPRRFRPAITTQVLKLWRNGGAGDLTAKRKGRQVVPKSLIGCGLD
jgi:hypothetical protein